MTHNPSASVTRGSPLEVFWVFLRLGLTSFGGPVAHIGYFREAFIVRRTWLSEAAFADLVALCQMLPGPASSQVGFAIGLMRAGWWGALAAWAGFTLPSAILMTAFAFGAGRISGPTGAGVLHGLKLAAVAIVAQAVWGMARSLAPDRNRAAIATVAVGLVLLAGSSLSQIVAILLGGLIGVFACRDGAVGETRGLASPVSPRAGAVALALFGALLLGLPLAVAASSSPALKVFEAFSRSGALVFGGGHVVLPLLRETFVRPGWISDDTFLAGYGAAQAVPGPLFSFAAYLGGVAKLGPGGLLGAAVGLVGLFLPGMLALVGALPFWGVYRARPGVQAMMRGVNAAVVGILGAALYNPVWSATVYAPSDVVIALAGFILLTTWKALPLLVVAMTAIAGVLPAMFGD